MVFLREKEGVAERGNQQPENLPQHTAGKDISKHKHKGLCPTA